MYLRYLYSVLLLCLFINCKQLDARKPISQKTGSFIKESVERNKELIAEEELYIQKIIKTDTSCTYLSSENGFWYTYIVKDTLGLAPPQIGDQVTFNYDLQTLNGRTILSQENIGVQDYIIDKTNQELISGIREGLKLMKVGETVRFLLPSHLAYGYYGFEDKIGSNIPVRTTVTLTTIKE